MKKDYQTNVVHKLNCKNCNKCHTAQIKLYLRKRFCNHQYTVSHNIIVETTLSKHSKEKRHNFNLEKYYDLKKEKIIIKNNL